MTNSITFDNYETFLTLLGFHPKDGTLDIYCKKYVAHKNYTIEIEINYSDFQKSKIHYGSKIKIGRKTTCNFKQQENFVVLECIDRLLEKGYSPELITLEKTWKLGHNESGSLDIFIEDKNKKPFLMIECKCWGEEFKKAINRTYYDGGQMFSYFTQDKDVDYLCLYTSTLEDNVKYQTAIIAITEDMKNATSNQEVFEKWVPQTFEEKGLFESSSKPYSAVFNALTKEELVPLTENDGGDIFNRFEEILRRNVISDKTNAYNKIFNLFLCKIVDEYETSDKEAVKFQWGNNETNETVLLRLNELYKRGMKEYLDLHISAIDISEIESRLNAIKSEAQKEKIKQLFIEQKLYSSNDFAFREVIDKKTFDLNCIVVKEVVKLLEPYQIKYETKQQFLGDFFEKLLNTGIKQEVGQYFTPVPIARFIAKSLPLKKIINDKIKNRETFILPYCLDYASGAGHFLTETMDEINHHISELDPNNILNNKAKQNFVSYKDNFAWAKEHIYGIEKDYRLAKTTKIATFLNGDGDATIIFGDGLDHFSKSKDYRNKLLLSSESKKNEVFDIIVANPPYSISGFKTTLPHGKKSFDLYEKFTDKSKEIECLFIERTIQLMHEGSCAGIVLPTSIIEGEKIYTLARKLLLKNFKIKGIVKLGKNTFMATNTITVIMFLERIGVDFDEIKSKVINSIKNESDFSINGLKKPIEKYSSEIFNKNFSEFLKGLNSDSKIQKEAEKITFYLIHHNEKTVFYSVPQQTTKQEQNALGYKFSNRKGYEGIYIFNTGGTLYNPKFLNDTSKINNYILMNFENKPLVKSDVKGLQFLETNKMINFRDNNSLAINTNIFEIKEKTISKARLNVLYQIKREEVSKKFKELFKEYEKKYKPKKDLLRNLVSVPIQSGNTPHTRNSEYWQDGKYNWLKIEDMGEKYISQTEKKITEKAISENGLKTFSKGTILFSIFGTIGKIGILQIETTINQAICAIVPDEKSILPEFVYYTLLANTSEISSSKLHKTQDNINKTKLEIWNLPYFEDLKIQNEIIRGMQKFEAEYELKK